MSFKYFHILILALIGILCIAPIIAQEDYVTLETLGIIPFTNDTIVEINNISFNIPEGYGEYNDSSFDNETVVINHTNYLQSRHEYKNETLDTITIVVYYNVNQSTDPTDDIEVGENETMKVINGYKGFLGNETGQFTFKYVKDNKVVVITAKDEATISKIII